MKWGIIGRGLNYFPRKTSPLQQEFSGLLAGIPPITFRQFCKAPLKNELVLVPNPDKTQIFS